MRSFREEDVGFYRIIAETAGFSRRKLVDRMIAAQALAARAQLATLNVGLLGHGRFDAAGLA